MGQAPWKRKPLDDLKHRDEQAGKVDHKLPDEKSKRRTITWGAPRNLEMKGSDEHGLLKVSIDFGRAWDIYFWGMKVATVSNTQKILVIDNAYYNLDELPVAREETIRARIPKRVIYDDIETMDGKVFPAIRGESPVETALKMLTASEDAERWRQMWIDPVKEDIRMPAQADAETQVFLYLCIAFTALQEECAQRGEELNESMIVRHELILQPSGPPTSRIILRGSDGTPDNLKTYEYHHQSPHLLHQ